MKKEKKEKEVKTKVKSNKIQKLIKLLNVGEIILIALPLTKLGLIIIMTILGFVAGEGVQGFYDGIQLANEAFGETMIVFGSNFDKVYYELSVVVSCIGYVVNILIINSIKKMLINMDEDKTPFSEKNIVILKKLRKYTIFSFVSLLLGNQFGMNVIPVIIVLGLISIFKYGIELQREVDETL